MKEKEEMFFFSNYSHLLLWIFTFSVSVELMSLNCQLTNKISTIVISNSNFILLLVLLFLIIT